ncbi:MAG: nuclear transport factor 2 family protein [Halieaceae bacterium]
MSCRALPLFFLLLLSAPMLSAQNPAKAEAAAALDAFHRAAAQADLDAYLALMTDDMVFLGTDGGERWQGEAFRSFASEHFSAGRGWTYTPTQRHLTVAASGDWARFDELLDNATLGQCRGSGLLLRQQGAWRIAQYNLSVPVPNAMVVDLARAIRSSAAAEISAADISAAEPGAAELVTPEKSAPEELDVMEAPVAPEAEKRCRKRHKTNRQADC